MGGNGVGSIINISSGAGLVGQSWAAAYNASKAAVHLLAKSTAIQYARDGIRANSVHPGAIDTQMLAAGSEQIGDSEAFNRPWVEWAARKKSPTAWYFWLQANQVS